MWLYFSEPGYGFIVLLFGSLRKMHIWPKEKKFPQVIVSGHKLQQLCKETLKNSWPSPKVACTWFHILKEVEVICDAAVDRGRYTHRWWESKPMSCFPSSLSKLFILLQSACRSPSSQPISISWQNCFLVKTQGPLGSFLLSFSAFPCSSFPFLYVSHDTQEALSIRVPMATT